METRTASRHEVQPPAAARHVLVVDSEIYVWGVVRAALDCAGAYRVTTTSTRSAALRTLTGDKPDVLLVDMLLSRTPGLPLAMCALSRGIPVIMATSDHELARRWQRLGCPTLWKPFHLSELEERLRQAIDAPADNRRRFQQALTALFEQPKELQAILQLSGSLRDQLLAALQAARTR